jgi:hypothetical protein
VASASPPGAGPGRTPVAALCLLASILGFLSCFAVWVDRQALNADNWTNVSGEVLESRAVEEALSAYLVNELFTSVNVAGELQSALPKQARPLAGPAAAGLRALADRAVPPLLASARIHAAWRGANRVAIEQLLVIIDGGGRVLSTRNGEVSLDLHALVTALASQMGLQNQVEAVRKKVGGAVGAAGRAAAEQSLGVRLHSESGRLVIMRSNQLRTAQNIAAGIRGLAVVLPLLSIALFALAVGLARGWRRMALRRVGWCLFAVGSALLLARRVAGDQIVNGLVANPSNRAAAHAVWAIGTSLLRNLAIAVAVYGLLLVAAAWLSGATRPAVFVRQALAPSLREHAAGAYLAAASALLLIVVWGPTPSTRQIVPVLGLAALLALAITALRRQTALEFPQAQKGDALASLRHGVLATRARWGTVPVPPDAPTRPQGGEGPDAVPAPGEAAQRPSGGALP